MIKIKNISTSIVTIALPDIRLRREIKPGMTMPFKEEEYEFLPFDPGFNALISGHYIKILNAPKVEAEEEEVENTKEATDIQTILKNRDITAFAKFIPNATAAEKDSVLKYAVDLGVVDKPFAALIKQYCGVDIINAISNYHQSQGN